MIDWESMPTEEIESEMTAAQAELHRRRSLESTTKAKFVPFVS